MTGDGAVVRRKWKRERSSDCTIDEHGNVIVHPEAEHNALVAHARQQAAEIERLTRAEAEWRGHAGWWMNKANELNATSQKFEKMANELSTGNTASEARTADLLKALEEYGKHHGVCPHSADPFTSQECRCGLVETLAAAKGGTV